MEDGARTRALHARKETSKALTVKPYPETRTLHARKESSKTPKP